MKVKKIIAAATAVLCCSMLGFVGEAVAAGPVANVDDLVAKHLDSIATAKVRADLKNRVAQGPVQFKLLVGGAGTVDGKAVLVSEGKKFQFMMKLPNTEYRGEQFVFDGDKDKVAFSTARQTRSALGDFIFGQDAPLHEGLWGGVLSTAWPLLQLEERKPKLNLEGLKKMDGVELYDLHYRPRKSTDLDIHLYFDPQTFHHVETVYSYSVSQGLGRSPISTGVGGTASPGSPDSAGTPNTQGSSPDAVTARQQQTRYRLQEKFSDFKTVDGVTLPTHYDIQFTQELQNGRTTLSEWEMKALDIANNVTVDPKNFDAK